MKAARGQKPPAALLQGGEGARSGHTEREEHKQGVAGRLRLVPLCLEERAEPVGGRWVPALRSNPQLARWSWVGRCTP